MLPSTRKRRRSPKALVDVTTSTSHSGSPSTSSASASVSAQARLPPPAHKQRRLRTPPPAPRRNVLHDNGTGGASALAPALSSSRPRGGRNVTTGSSATGVPAPPPPLAAPEMRKRKAADSEVIDLTQDDSDEGEQLPARRENGAAPGPAGSIANWNGSRSTGVSAASSKRRRQDGAQAGTGRVRPAAGGAAQQQLARTGGTGATDTYSQVSRATGDEPTRLGQLLALATMCCDPERITSTSLLVCAALAAGYDDMFVLISMAMGMDAFFCYSLWTLRSRTSGRLFGFRPRGRGAQSFYSMRYQIMRAYLLCLIQIHRRSEEPAAPPVERPVQPSHDDKEGHYIPVPGEHLTRQYKIVRLLGQGTFGKVVEAIDAETNRRVAIKIIRAVQKYRDASKVEIRVLNTLKMHDPSNSYRCIHLLECFDVRHHICMVFELLAQSLFDFLKENSFHPFPLHHIRDFAIQILEAVSFLHRLGLVHTDLKPENLMLVRKEVKQVTENAKRSTRGKKSHLELKNTEIRLIDFGSAIFDVDYHSSIVSTRHYRAPEIILGTGWSFPCDMWSIGCILVEFYTGDALFQTHDNLEHLGMMERILGPIPERVAKLASHVTPKYFRADHTIDYPNAETSKSSRNFVRKLKPLHKMIDVSTPEGLDFYELCRGLLRYEKDLRWTAKDALRCAFLNN